jgi:hypothetical protein
MPTAQQLGAATAKVVLAVETVLPGHTPVTRAYATMQAAVLLLVAAGCDKARTLESFTVLLDILEAKAN